MPRIFRPCCVASCFLTVALFSAAPASAQNEPPSTPLPVPDIFSATRMKREISIDELVRRALQNNPRPAIARANLEAARQRAGALKSLPNPILQIVVGFIGSQEAREEEIILSQPLDLFGQRKAQRRVFQVEARRVEAESTLVSRAAPAEVKVQESQLVLLRSQAASQVEQALIRLDQQRATVERYRSGIVPQTLDLLRKTQIGYDAGASTYLEVLEAQRTLRATQTEYLQALVGVRTSEAQLESALGATPPENLLNAINNPQGPSTPDGVSAPGTIPQGTFPPIEQAPLNPPLLDLPATNANPGGRENR